jgi:glucose/arabinose dehydrogenase
MLQRTRASRSSVRLARGAIALLATLMVVAGCQLEPNMPATTSSTRAGAQTSPSAHESASSQSSSSSSITTLKAVLREPKGTTTIATGLITPWGLAFLPNGDALVSIRRSDEILRVTPQGAVSSVGRVDGLALDTDEGGMLGLAVPPGRSDVVYVYMTAATDNRVIRMSFSEGRLGKSDPVVTGITKGRNHNGGRLAFDADGYLYISTGDARRGELAQELGSLNGKILKVDVDGNPAPGNPFNSAVYSYGHRNVQGLAFDSTGTLWATEFGNEASDELNRIEPGGNYGWPTVEGDSDDTRFVRPFVSWSPTKTASPSGLAIMDDVAYIGAHQGHALFAVPLAGEQAGTTTEYLKDVFGRIRTVSLAPDGSLWIMTTNRDGYLAAAVDDDKIIRVDF